MVSDIELRTAQLHLDTPKGRIWHTTFSAINHNGTVSITPGNENTAAATSSDNKAFSDAHASAQSAARDISEEKHNHTVLTAEKVNACSVLIVKERTTGQIHMLHHTPDQLKKVTVYDELFSQIPDGAEIDVLACDAKIKTELLQTKCAKKNVSIKTARKIGLKTPFTIDPMVLQGEPRSVHITYDPTNDRLIIFGDELNEQKTSGCYVADNIFTAPDADIHLTQIVGIATQHITEMKWNHFHQYMSLFSKDLMERTLGKDARETTYTTSIDDLLREIQKENPTASIPSPPRITSSIISLERVATDHTTNVKNRREAAIKDATIHR